MKNKFTGVCVLISALIVSIVLMFNALINRYYVSPNLNEFKNVFIFDKLTGIYYGFIKDENGYQKIRKIDFIKSANK